jgi:hypothetical protein
MSIYFYIIGGIIITSRFIRFLLRFLAVKEKWLFFASEVSVYSLIALGILQILNLVLVRRKILAHEDLQQQTCIKGNTLPKLQSLLCLRCW